MTFNPTEPTKVIMSFPGLGIDNFTVDSIAFTLFGKFEVRWYGLIITLGMILAVIYAGYRFKQEKISIDDLMDMAIFTIIFGVIGARLYYVLTSLDQYHSLKDAIAIWEGGLAIYGGIIAGGLTIFCVCKYKKINPMKAFDAVAPGVMIGQFLGRWGNFFNGEAFGDIVSEGHPLYFLRMGLSSYNTLHDFKTYEMVFVHPTFLYESLWNILGFVLINVLYKKKKFDGQIFFTYIAWYGFGRMFIELLRTDSLYVGPIRISSLVGLICFITGVSAITYKILKIKKGNGNIKQPAESETAIDTEEPEEITETSEIVEAVETVETVEYTDVSDKLKNLMNKEIKKDNDN